MGGLRADVGNSGGTVAAATGSLMGTAGVSNRLAVIVGGTVVFSVCACVAGLTGVLPSGISTAIVMLGMGVMLKVLWTHEARSASSASRDRMTVILSNTGLIISAIVTIAALPRLTKTSGVAVLLVDLAAQLWTIALLTAAAGPARTLGWRVFASTFFFGFLGLGGLARFIGRPIVVTLGMSSVLAVGIWVPITEELIKLLPVIFIVMVARRRTESRPSVFDLVLIGAWAGAGFAVNEDAGYGRGAFSLDSQILSMVFPSAVKGVAFGWNFVQTGHLVHTAVIALGVGFAMFYGRRLSRPWMVPMGVIAAVLLEHCSQNSIVVGGLNRIIAYGTLIVTLGGRLCMLAMIGGVAYLVMLEWRVVGTKGPIRDWLLLPSDEARRRSVLLAAAQVTAATAVPHAAAGDAA